MAWRIAKNVVKGVLDNRQKDMVTGTLWLAGKSAPINLEIRGNFLRDMAGCELTFENPHPVAGETMNVSPIQVGMTGDMTASRKVTVIDLPIEEIMKHKGTPDQLPRRKANALYLEWFSETDGRMVIESTDFKVELGMPLWTMTADEEAAQISHNRESFRQWLEHLSELEDMELDPGTTAAKKPMNEFEWEKLLKDSDRKNERLSEVLEKYHGHPDSEKLIAREMGWTWVEEELEAQERGVFADLDDDENDDDFEADGDSYDEIFDDDREPNPLREGIDWVRDIDGSIEHPLALRTLRFSASFWKDLEDAGMLEDTGDSRVFELAGLIESISVRLSNTLGELAYDDEVDSGFVIAGLKRSVHLIHQSLNMLQAIEPMNIISLDRAKSAQRTLFELREDIISMMKTFREKR